MGLNESNWTDEEDQQLIALRQRSFSFREIRDHYMPGRSIQSQRQRVAYLVNEGLVPKGFEDPTIRSLKGNNLRAANEHHVRAIAHYYARHEPRIHAYLLEKMPVYRSLSELRF